MPTNMDRQPEFFVDLQFCSYQMLKGERESKTYFFFNKVDFINITYGHVILKINYIIKLYYTFKFRRIVFIGGWLNVEIFYIKFQASVILTPNHIHVFRFG